MGLAQTSSPEVVLDCRNQLGESILWDDRDQKLWWVNIHRAEAWRWDPASDAAADVFPLPERVGALALRQEGGIALALASGFALLDTADGRVTRLAEVEPGLPTTRLNDGRVDPAGRFVCGGMDEADPQQPLSAVYALERDGDVRRLLGGVHCANSICWSPDGGTFYFTDMPSRRIDAYAYDVATGTIGPRRPFVSLEGEPGWADGSVVDAEGYLWNAQWGGAKVVRYSPDGTVEREIPVPADHPTCLTFGGPDLDILFITSAWFGIDEANRVRQPHAGSLFALRPGVRGLPEHRYAG
jgi:L-arabinonolactonase